MPADLDAEPSGLEIDADEGALDGGANNDSDVEVGSTPDAEPDVLADARTVPKLDASNADAGDGTESDADAQTDADFGPSPDADAGETGDDGCDECLAQQVGCVAAACAEPCGTLPDNAACRACACVNGCVATFDACSGRPLNVCADCDGTTCTNQSRTAAVLIAVLTNQLLL